MTEPFLSDGLAAVTAISTDLELQWGAIPLSIRTGGADRVLRSVTTSLATSLGYRRPMRQGSVATREGPEDGGWLLQAANGSRLRTWSIASDTDLDAMGRSSSAYRSSPTRVAQRVLRACGESAGLVTNGEVLRLLLCDPAHADSHLSIGIDRGGGLPDAAGFVPDAARHWPERADCHACRACWKPRRLHQARVTTELAASGQGSHRRLHQCTAETARPRSGGAVAGRPGAGLPAAVHPEAGKPCRTRRRLQLCLHPSVAGRAVAKPGAGRPGATASGSWARHRTDARRPDCGRCSRIFRDGLSCSELRIAPLGGALFGSDTTPLLDRLDWGDALGCDPA